MNNDPLVVKDVLTRLGYVLRRDNDGWRTNRIYAGGDNITALKVFYSGRWIDFVENKTGTLIDLVRLTLHLKSIQEAEDWLLKNSVADAAPPQVRDAESVKLAKKYEPDILKRLSSVHDYWLNRGIMESTLALFKGGVCLHKSKMQNRYVFPIFDVESDKIVGFAGRALGDEKPKWKFLGQRTFWAYPLFLNRDNIAEKRAAILCESIGDLLSLWDAGYKNAICCFGLSLTPAIISWMLRLRVENIIIAFNNDSGENGAGNIAAVKVRTKLSSYFDPENISIVLPVEKDWNEALIAEGVERIRAQMS